MSTLLELKDWKTLKIGNSGEKFLKKFCLENNMQYRKGTDEENLVFGVDAYVLNVPTDIKTTCKIFLGRYPINENKFYPRHPFREQTKAVNYAIIDGDGKTIPHTIRYMGSIEHYLVKTFFKSNFSFERVKGRLQFFSGKSYNQLGYRSQDQLLRSIKEEVTHHVISSTYCGYVSMDQANNYKIDELSIYLMTRVDYRKEKNEGKIIF
jgi:hypothetical protein